MKKLHEKMNQEFNNDNPFRDKEGLIYARVSSKKQELEGSGLVSQEGRCINDLRTIGVPHLRTFSDAYTGGGDFMKRPAIRELLAYIDAHPYKEFVVVFDDLKRFARDVEFHFKLRHAFRRRSVVLRCLNYNFDDSPEGEFAELIMSGQAQLERKQNRRQVIQKMKARLELGYFCFAHKRGYTMKKDAIHGRILVPNKEAQILKEVLEGFACGIFSRQIDVARFLYSKKFWKNRTAEAHLTDTSDILRDPIYCGDIQYLPWGITRRAGRHKAIISVETYERIQQRLKRDNSKARIRQDISPEFPLRGLIVCPECKEKLTAAQCRSHTKKLHSYYYCINKGCSLRSKSIRKDDLEREFRNLVKRNALKAEMDSILEDTFTRVWKEESHAYKAKQIAKAKLRKDREQELRELTDLARQSKSDVVRVQYEHRIEEVAQELKNEKEIDQNRGLAIPFRTAFTKAVTMLKNPINIWDSVDHKEKQHLFFFLFNDRLAYSKTEAFRTSDSLCITRVFEEFCDENSDDVDIALKTSNYIKKYLSRFWEYYQNNPTLQKLLSLKPFLQRNS